MISSSAFGSAYGHAASPENERAALKRLDALATMLDSAFALPIVGTRIGAEALLNVVPGAGVVVAKGLSAWLVWEAYRLGVPRTIIRRMAGNVAIDLGISLVPVAGWVGDVFFRANMRNMGLLRGHLAERHPVQRMGREPDAARPAVTIEGEVVRGGAR